MSEIFGDMISNEELESAKQKLEPISDAYYSMREEINNANEGLRELMVSIEQTYNSFSQLSENPRLLENIKSEFDKTAYLMDKFVSKFKPMYQDCSNRYLAEKLAGSFDIDLNAFRITGTLPLTVSGSTIVGNSQHGYASGYQSSNSNKKNSWNKKRV
ncbi:hypothetical protein D3C87_79930 [compost metagenome]